VRVEQGLSQPACPRGSQAAEPAIAGLSVSELMAERIVEIEIGQRELGR
jgi:hypothetical protein